MNSTTLWASLVPIVIALGTLILGAFSLRQKAGDQDLQRLSADVTLRLAVLNALVSSLQDQIVSLHADVAVWEKRYTESERALDATKVTLWELRQKIGDLENAARDTERRGRQGEQR
jgi:sensor domain CHASE-containing protein